MIAPVKKFGPVRLSTNFPSEQIWRRMQTWKEDEFLLGFSRIQTSMDFLDIRRHDAWTVQGWLNFSWFGIPASSVMFKLREIYERPACSICYIFPLTAVLRLSSYPKHVLRAHCISMGLATVICECSLNQFSSSLFVSLFVQWEPQQIFKSLNTE